MHLFDEVRAYAHIVAVVGTRLASVRQAIGKDRVAFDPGPVKRRVPVVLRDSNYQHASRLRERKAAYGAYSRTYWIRHAGAAAV